MEGIIAFSEVQPSIALPGKMVQIFACPMWSKDQEVVGAVLGVMVLDDLNRIFTHQDNE